MPLGVERLNVRKSQPNDHIVFIKPLKGSDDSRAQEFLERIAAQCLPVMRDHHIYVMSLEEFPPNREFVGRNFNAGEVIQLVLKSPTSGRWLPFEYVQMVMMHELAHCKQMNHSRAFWSVRNGYAAEMRALWGKGYTGDGVWGRGAKLGTGEWERDTVQPGEVLPEHLCGGTFRSRKRRSKNAKPVLSYQERKQRRIEKKFGKNGVALGEDVEVKVKLEKGKKVQGKPRVAGSARGRELRAAAALARFEQKREEPIVIKKDEDETESGSDTEDDQEDMHTSGTTPAVDVDGKPLVDGKGRGMVKVCGDEDKDDPGAETEFQELRDVFMGRKIKQESPEPPSISSSSVEHPEKEKKDPPSNPVKIEQRTTTSREVFGGDTHVLGADGNDADTTHQMGETHVVCLTCSYTNPPRRLTCEICANVIDPAAIPNSWRCSSELCKDGAYRNSGDCGVCGVCGLRRPDQT
ncbi:unnamed protein product [Clonostachys solani]|uniref:WLM domain-containing protein n=1 Tax=Clonostachys solani TaxID=160281 RepID=A0A9N9Z5Y8_9HYPO|nr:unnamed protein product [Clonostachys solani]